MFYKILFYIWYIEYLSNVSLVLHYNHTLLFSQSIQSNSGKRIKNKQPKTIRRPLGRINRKSAAKSQREMSSMSTDNTDEDVEPSTSDKYSIHGNFDALSTSMGRNKGRPAVASKVLVSSSEEEEEEGEEEDQDQDEDSRAPESSRELRSNNLNKKLEELVAVVDWGVFLR